MMMAPDMSMGMAPMGMSMANMAMAPGLDTAPAMAPESSTYGQTIPLSKVRRSVPDAPLPILALRASLTLSVTGMPAE